MTSPRSRSIDPSRARVAGAPTGTVTNDVSTAATVTTDNLAHCPERTVMKRWMWVLPLLLAATLVAAQDRAAQGQASRAVEWPVLRRRSRRHAALDVDRHQRRERAAAAAGLAVETLGDAAQGIRHGARAVRGDAADDRRHAVRDHAVQQHRGARRRDRQGALALRRRGVRTRSGALGQRVETARHRGLA